MYKRFLKDSDYLSLLTKEAFNQLVRGVEDRVWEAEEVSEATIVEYLRDKFEIEKTLRVGKAIQEYNPQITYPAGACFSIGGTIVRALKTLNGRKSPVTTVYWSEYTEPVDRMTEEEELRVGRVFGDDVVDLESIFTPQHTQEPIIRKARKYTQRDTYKPGDIVYFANKVFLCLNTNGPDVSNIQVPGVVAWEEVSYEEWEPLKHYKKNDIVKYDGNFYVLLKDYTEPEPAPSPEPDPDEEEGGDGTFGGGENTEQEPEEEIETQELDEEIDDEPSEVPDEDVSEEEPGTPAENEYDPSIAPSEAPDEVWGMIADYNQEETYEFKDTEWVVFDDKVFIPAMDPNATSLQEGVTHAQYDPRNANIKKHLLRMAVYELHKIIAPHNISTARITDYEATMQWLQDASRLKIDPSIPRRINKDSQKPVSTYGLATFRREYNPMENEWQI